MALGQIERTLIAVIRQVATSRGMNLVLHRAQVALNMNEFDITEEVTKQLNQVLPSVTVPPDDAFAKVTAASLQAQQQQQQAAVRTVGAIRRLVQPIAGDPRFFLRAGPFPLSLVLETIGVAGRQVCPESGCLSASRRCRPRARTRSASSPTSTIATSWRRRGPAP